MVHSFRWILLITLASSALADTMETGTLSYTYTFNGTFPVTSGGASFGFGNGVPDFSLPQFDPDLGSLEGVSIDVSASLSGSVNLFNQLGENPQCLMNPTLDGCTHVISGNFWLYLSGDDSAGDSTGLAVADRTVVSSGTPVPPFGSATVPLLLSGTSPFLINSLLPYIGTGQLTFSDVGAFVEPPIGTGLPFGHNVGVFAIADQFPVTVDLTYTFTPSAVPEPSFLWPLGVFFVIWLGATLGPRLARRPWLGLV